MASGGSSNGKTERELSLSSSSFDTGRTPSPQGLNDTLADLNISSAAKQALRVGLDFSDGNQLDHIDRIFVNRSLNMNTIKYVGFDMDYTLAIYKSPIYDEFSYGLIMQRIVSIGYPKELLNKKYDASFPQRGLFFDREYGNLLKLDMYGNLLLCLHGFNELDAATVRRCYPSKFATPSEDRFYCLNTLFNLPEVYILAMMVDFYDHHSDFKKLESSTGVESEDLILTYSSIFHDVRMAIDYIHMEGSLKAKTLEDLPAYVDKVAKLPLLLHELRESRRKVFLITNSGWHYTKCMMEYLFDLPHGPKPGTAHRPWHSYFDFIVVDARKPLFFDTGTVLRQVDPSTGALKIGKFKGEVRDGETCYWAGGSSEVFCQLTGARGKEILFVGDHIFGDILRSKKQQGWRTFLVVPELNDEIQDWQRAQGTFNQLKTLEFLLSRMCRMPGEAEMSEVDIKRIRDAIKSTAVSMDACHRSRLGSLFRSGSRQSYFAMQAMRYADLYASSFVNLVHYPHRYLFRAPHQLMPHEQSVPMSSPVHLKRVPSMQSTYYHDEDDEDSDETAESSCTPSASDSDVMNS